MTVKHYKPTEQEIRIGETAKDITKLKRRRMFNKPGSKKWLIDTNLIEHNEVVLKWQKESQKLNSGNG